MLLLALSLTLVVYLIGVLFSPFPYWRTYLVLWRFILFQPTPGIGASARARQAAFLVRHFLLNPVWTALWYLDKLLFSEYRRLPVRPVFIIGQPRSGTTMLHRTLGADTERFLAVRHIEWRFPFIVVQRLFEVFNLSDRLRQRSYWPDTRAGREARRMHADNLYDYEEDGIFYEESFLHHFFVFLRFPYPQLLSYLDDFPGLPRRFQKRLLHTHREVIQKMMYLRGNAGLLYLSKEVTSHNKIPYLLQLYPDAQFILIIRSASDFMDSLLALVRISTIAKTGVDPTEVPGWKEVFMERMRKDSALLVELCENTVDPECQVRVSFSKFTKDICSGVKSIYQQLGIVLSDSYLEYLQTLSISQGQRDRGYTYSRDPVRGFDRFDRFAAAVEKQVGGVAANGE